MVLCEARAKQPTTILIGETADTKCYGDKNF